MARIRDNANSFTETPRGEGRPGVRTSDNGPIKPLMATVSEGVAAGAGVGGTPFTVARNLATSVNPAVREALRSDLQPVQPPITRLRPDLIDVIRPPLILRPPVLLPRTTTQIARGAIGQLHNTAPAVVQEAINTVRNKNIAADGLMSYLERKVIIGEVLNELAKDWSAETKGDFVEAFQMNPDRLEVMDAMVSLAILNDRHLKDELQIENTPEATSDDLMANRRIVWQHPPPGTPLTPPYVVLVAVEYRDTMRAEEVIQSILGELADYQGFKIPRTVAQRL